MYSSTTIIGNVGKDPEVKTFSNGNCVASFSVATTRYWKDKQGQKQQKTQWHNVECYQSGERGLVTNLVVPYVKKGDRIHVVGEYTSRKDDQSRYWYQLEVAGINGTINLLGGSGKNDAGGSGNNDAGGHQINDQQVPDLDDEIPF